MSSEAVLRTEQNSVTDTDLEMHSLCFLLANKMGSKTKDYKIIVKNEQKINSTY